MLLTLLSPAPTRFYIRVGGVWKEAAVFIRVGGVWKAALPAIKVTGTWNT
jgi:hypothetical protein